MGLNFTLLDLETPNSKNDSICALGAAKVRDGVITSTLYHIINPEANFHGCNTRIHGITAKDVETEPTLDKVWPEYCKFIGDDLVLTFNAGFDMPVLCKALRKYDMKHNHEYRCAMEMAKKVLGYEKRYGLDVYCAKYGIPLEHHNAESDAVAAAQLVMLIAEHLAADTIEELVYLTDGMITPKGIKSTGGKQNTTDSVDDLWLTDEPIFDGLNILFTGAVANYERDDLEHVVKSLKGTIKKNMSRKVDILISGRQDASNVKDGTSNKHRDALAMREEGHGIYIADQTEFLSWICGDAPLPDELCVHKKDITKQAKRVHDAQAVYSKIIEGITASCAKDKEYVDFRFAKDNKALSVFFYEQMGMKVTVGKNVAHVAIEGKYSERAQSISSSYRSMDSASSQLLRLYIEDDFDYERFFELAAAICDDLKSSATVERFGCCSLFIECSNARECLHKNEPEYLGCYYRDNLEAGRIFYGKNKNIAISSDVNRAKTPSRENELAVKSQGAWEQIGTKYQRMLLAIRDIMRESRNCGNMLRWMSVTGCIAVHYYGRAVCIHYGQTATYIALPDEYTTTPDGLDVSPAPKAYGVSRRVKISDHRDMTRLKDAIVLLLDTQMKQYETNKRYYGSLDTDSYYLAQYVFPDEETQELFTD